MTVTEPLNNQLPPQTNDQPRVLKSQNRVEQPSIQLTDELLRIAGPVAAAPSAASPTAATRVKPAEHTPPEISSRAEAERLEVAERIAAFRNLQVRLRQEREKYYDTELARTRSLLAKSLNPRR